MPSEQLPTPYGRSDLIWLLVGLLALFLVVIINLIGKIPPLQDLNSWVYQGFLIKRLLLGHAGPAALKHWPVPNAFSQICLAAMTTVLSPITTAKAFASLYLVVGGAVMLRLSRRSDNTVDGLRFLLLICLVVIHSPYWAGEINYQIGSVILAFYLVTDSDRSQPSLPVDTLTAVLLYFCHALCLGVFIIYIGWRSLLRGGLLKSAISILPSIALLVWYAAMDPRPDRVDPNSALNVEPLLSGPVDWIAYKGYIIAKMGPYQNFIIDNIGDFERCKAFYVIGVIVNVCFAGAMCLLFLNWFARSLKQSVYSVQVLTALSCVAVAIINPGRRLGIGNASERLFYLAVTIVVLFPLEPSRLRRLCGVFGAFLPIFAIYILLIRPHASVVESPDWSAMNQADARMRILFWHRPFMYQPQIEAAQEAFSTGTTPNADIVYQTSLLRHNP